MGRAGRGRAHPASRILRGRDWPTDARQPVAELADGLDQARKEWAKAAAAPDTDTFYVHYEKGFKLLAPETTVTARKALGLATTPPSDDRYDGDGGDGAGMEV
ncbi:hypothetical protein [Streptomyces sp. NPDC046805]|uniref:hypothetical protein n=1 Tax=Streptomyces sp. NPDC046805 TaxID=3155134 RepID=UPI00340FF54E